MTIEFWFKLGSQNGYSTLGSHIFSLATESYEEIFFEIGIVDNVLTCAPFGSTKEIPFGGEDTTPKVIFPEFSFENQSETGWWHLSCSFSYRGYIKASLFNEDNLNAVKSERLTRINT
jgi:hypothetical protein